MTEPTIFSPEGMEPDAGAVEQIKRCLADERAPVGVVMAGDDTFDPYKD